MSGTAAASVTQGGKVRTESPEGLGPKALCPSEASKARSFVKLFHPPLRIKMLPKHQYVILKIFCFLCFCSQDDGHGH